MAKRIRLSFPEEVVSCTAVLMEEKAPKTCAVIWENLPLQGKTVHGMYSGPEIFIAANQLPDLEQENGVHRPLPGDVGYWLNPGGRYALSPVRTVEVVVIYDRGAAIMGPDGVPTFINLFAQAILDESWVDFQQVARRVRIEGPKILRVERVTDC